MLTIRGSSIITTDWHFGNNNDSQKYHRILLESVKSILKFADEHSADNLIFCGDMFHKRNMISVDTINIAIRCLDSVSRHFKHMYLILGNHDLFNQSNTEIHSTLMFKNIRNVTIIDKPEEVSLNGKKCLFIPWTSDMSTYEKGSFDMLFGHFDISNRYLALYNRSGVTRRRSAVESLSSEIDSDELLNDESMKELEVDSGNTEETYVCGEKTSDLIGNWIESVREGGTIFAGHIHNHGEIYARGRKLIFIGSPYQLNRGEMNSDDGFYFMKEDSSYTFERSVYPEHIDVRISEIARNPDGFDYGKLNGKIVHKVYDIEIDAETDNRITKRIIDSRPYDELKPDYEITKRQDGTDISSVAIDTLRKSTLEYLRMSVFDMDDSVFEGKGFGKEELFNFTRDYYERAGGN